jgi:hypothetical protein
MTTEERLRAALSDLAEAGPPMAPDLPLLARLRRRRRRRALVGAASALVLLFAIAGSWVESSDLRTSEVSPGPSVSTSPRPGPAPVLSRLPEYVSGLVIGSPPPEGTLERTDDSALDGAWTVIVRRSDGALGRHGAVVTFPVPRPGNPTYDAAPGSLVWRIGGGYARVRGDLPQQDLTAIAAATTVTGGRPVVRPPAGFHVVASTPAVSPVIAEARYGSAALGEGAALGDGLTFTGVCLGGGFEDQLYAVGLTSTLTVRGVPAVASQVVPGNGGLAWEMSPGVVAYVGYSGVPLDGAAVAALRRLAEHSRPLTAAGWQVTSPVVIQQSNAFG